jgi:hypothetical protein
MGAGLTAIFAATTTDNREPTTDNRQPRTDNREPTTENRQPRTDVKLPGRGSGRLLALESDELLVQLYEYEREHQKQQEPDDAERPFIHGESLEARRAAHSIA